MRDHHTYYKNKWVERGGGEKSKVKLISFIASSSLLFVRYFCQQPVCMGRSDVKLFGTHFIEIWESEICAFFASNVKKNLFLLSLFLSPSLLGRRSYFFSLSPLPLLFFASAIPLIKPSSSSPTAPIAISRLLPSGGGGGGEDGQGLPPDPTNFRPPIQPIAKKNSPSVLQTLSNLSEKLPCKLYLCKLPLDFAWKHWSGLLLLSRPLSYLLAGGAISQKKSGGVSFLGIPGEISSPFCCFV